ncbi:hypothetical protein LCGC14_0727340 [marine sediment metagenome]|uniref:Glycosyl transferase family 1 domain-containing protein n=1 Tax=marine sediment metagenome TaxID=412755 RepID=A0A0F9SVW1_9ZZZZ
MKVHIVCAHHTSGRILPRLALALASELGWSIASVPDPRALNYAFPYLELRSAHKLTMAGFFTHREDNAPLKVKIWNAQAARCELRMVLGPLDMADLQAHGPTYRAIPPLDRDLFTPSASSLTLAKEPRAGVSGFVTNGGRKGEKLLTELVRSDTGQQYTWDAVGRGWPVTTRILPFPQLAAWYNSLDVYFCPSLIEGVPYGPLEALACGVPVVIPRGVGLLDELPDIPGIVRYERGDAVDAARAFTELRETYGSVRRDDLRAATEPYTIEAWVQCHVDAFSTLDGVDDFAASYRPYWNEPPLLEGRSLEGLALEVEAREKKRGIYVVAYGAPARKCARQLIGSIRKYMPNIPVAVASGTPLDEADVHITYPDADLGGRAAKTKMFDLAPKEWSEVLYLDADIELTADISFLLDAVEGADGWDVALTKDQDDYDLIYSLWRRDSTELALGRAALGSSRALQLAGGVIAFRRNQRTKAFFHDWYAEWFRMARRDQGALIRSMYKQPVKLLVLGNEWNSHVGMFTGKTAGVLHHRGGPARRRVAWKLGRLDDPRNMPEMNPPEQSRHQSYWAPGKRNVRGFRR